ncbi:hypothetical protein ABT369_28300 [Dactylosporangium sp. NPDC000244]|uniref:hypothetical protein n=1 Tax=Dactylosporangium sp. NPDC000244 TaxID=3154365 RepID=UPI0033347148
MTVDLHPGRDYAADMQRVAADARRNTHLLVARGPHGDILTEHARPYLDAQLRAGEWRAELGSGWKVTVEAVSGWMR